VGEVVVEEEGEDEVEGKEVEEEEVEEEVEGEEEVEEEVEVAVVEGRYALNLMYWNEYEFTSFTAKISKLIPLLKVILTGEE